MTICPNCKGATTTRALSCFDDGHSEMTTVLCPICQGRGHIDDEDAERMAKGSRLRELRLRRDENLKQAAQRFGCTIVQYSAAEWGRVDTGFNYDAALAEVGS